MKAIDYLNRGLTLHTQGYYIAAIADFTKASVLFGNKNNASCFFNRGNAYKAQGNNAAAIADYTQACISYTDYNLKARCYFNRGTAQSEQGNYTAAVSDYTQASALFGDKLHKAHCFFNRGAAQRAQGHSAAAIADYTQACEWYENSPYKAYCYLDRGHIQLAQGNNPAAIRDFEQATRLYPKIKLSFELEQLKDFFNNFPAFYHHTLKQTLTFSQRQSACCQEEAPDPTNEHEDLFDPVTYSLMDDPISIPASGHTYDRKTIQEIFTQLRNPGSVPCPLTKKLITKVEFHQLATHVGTKKRIEKYIVGQEQLKRGGKVAANASPASQACEERAHTASPPTKNLSITAVSSVTSSGAHFFPSVYTSQAKDAISGQAYLPKAVVEAKAEANMQSTGPKILRVKQHSSGLPHVCLNIT